MPATTMRLPTCTMSKTLLSTICGVFANGTVLTTPFWATPTADAGPVPTTIESSTAGTTAVTSTFQNLRIARIPSSVEPPWAGASTATSPTSVGQRRWSCGS